MLTPLLRECNRRIAEPGVADRAMRLHCNDAVALRRRGRAPISVELKLSADWTTMMTGSNPRGARADVAAPRDPCRC